MSTQNDKMGKSLDIFSTPAVSTIKISTPNLAGVEQNVKSDICKHKSLSLALKLICENVN